MIRVVALCKKNVFYGQTMLNIDDRNTDIRGQ